MSNRFDAEAFASAANVAAVATLFWVEADDVAAILAAFKVEETDGAAVVFKVDADRLYFAGLTSIRRAIGTLSPPAPTALSPLYEAARMTIAAAEVGIVDDVLDHRRGPGDRDRARLLECARLWATEIAHAAADYRPIVVRIIPGARDWRL